MASDETTTTRLRMSDVVYINNYDVPPGHTRIVAVSEKNGAILRAAADDVAALADALRSHAGLPTVASLEAEMLALRRRVTIAYADGARDEREILVSALHVEIDGCVTPGTEYELALRLAIGIVEAGIVEAEGATHEAPTTPEEPLELPQGCSSSACAVRRQRGQGTASRCTCNRGDLMRAVRAWRQMKEVV